MAGNKLDIEWPGRWLDINRQSAYADKKKKSDGLTFGRLIRLCAKKDRMVLKSREVAAETQHEPTHQPITDFAAADAPMCQPCFQAAEWLSHPWYFWGLETAIHDSDMVMLDLFCLTYILQATCFGWSKIQLMVLIILFSAMFHLSMLLKIHQTPQNLSSLLNNLWKIHKNPKLHHLNPPNLGYHRTKTGPPWRMFSVSRRWRPRLTSSMVKPARSSSKVFSFKLPVSSWHGGPTRWCPLDN